ncbi:hypothetical protein C8Q80DRAFT_1266815 [Daedaleopsis nitida]|nr:hypothetical protein C8Q80DRAFT_1266815 [Daedaleopsis nitida]
MLSNAPAAATPSRTRSSLSATVLSPASSLSLSLSLSLAPPDALFAHESPPSRFLAAAPDSLFAACSLLSALILAHEHLAPPLPGLLPTPLIEPLSVSASAPADPHKPITAIQPYHYTRSRATHSNSRTSCTVIRPTFRLEHIRFHSPIEFIDVLCTKGKHILPPQPRAAPPPKAIPNLSSRTPKANLTQPRNRTRAARPLRPAQTIRASSASSPSTGAVFPTRTRRGDGGSHSDLARRGASVRCAATCSLESGHEAPSSRLASRIVPERARPSLPSPPPSDQRPAGTGDEGGGSRSDSAPAVPARTALRSLSFALTAARS